MTEQANTFQLSSDENVIYKRAVATGLLGSFLICIKSISGLRNHLPEPYDVVDHIGNVGGSLTAGLFGGLAAAVCIENTSLSRGNKNMIKLRARSAMLAGGLGVGAMLNAYTETKLGLSINPIFHDSTPDSVDFTYGVVAAGIGGLFGAKLEAAPIKQTS